MECWYKDVCNEEICDKESCLEYNAMLRCFKVSGLAQTLWYRKNLIAPSVDKQAYSRLNEIKQQALMFQQGKNLLLYSPYCGNGKTSWAIKLGQKFIEINARAYVNVRPFYYVYIPDLLFENKRCMQGHTATFDSMLQGLREADLVLWDDIGSVAVSNYDLLMLQSLIEARINQNKSNIFTTNSNDKELSANLGARLADRIINLSESIEFKATSMRGMNE